MLHLLRLALHWSMTSVPFPTMHSLTPSCCLPVSLASSYHAASSPLTAQAPQSLTNQIPNKRPAHHQEVNPNALEAGSGETFNANLVKQMVNGVKILPPVPASRHANLFRDVELPTKASAWSYPKRASNCKITVLHSCLPGSACRNITA